MRDAHTRVWEASTSFHTQPRIMEKGTDINYLDDLGAWQKTDTTRRSAGPTSAVPGAVLEAVRQRAKIPLSAIGEESFNISYNIEGQTIRTGVRAWVAPPQTDAATFRYAKFTAEGPNPGRMPNATN